MPLIAKGKATAVPAAPGPPLTVEQCIQRIPTCPGCTGYLRSDAAVATSSSVAQKTSSCFRMKQSISESHSLSSGIESSTLVDGEDGPEGVSASAFAASFAVRCMTRRVSSLVSVPASGGVSGAFFNSPSDGLSEFDASVFSGATFSALDGSTVVLVLGSSSCRRLHIRLKKTF